MKQRGVIFSTEEKLAVVKPQPETKVEAKPQPEREAEPQPEPKFRVKPEPGLSTSVQKLIQKYQASYQSQSPQEETGFIHVDEIASKVASFYEKVRKIVDWKEEHLIRRTAIERVLKRRMIAELSQFNLVPDLEAEKIAEPLILELIRGGHLSNNEVPQIKIAGVQRILEKYIYLLQNNDLAKNRSPAKLKDKINFYNWLLEIAACEIEELLAPPVRENALIESMAEILTARIRVKPQEAISEEEKKVQTYIAVHRALFRLDDPIIGYRLLKYRFPGWTKPSSGLLNDLTQKILMIRRRIEGDLKHPLGGEFFKIGEKYDALWLLLDDALKSLAKMPAQIPEKLRQPNILKKLVQTAYVKRLLSLKTRLFRMAIYSTLSIFIAGAFSLFVVEVPLAKLLYGKFSLLAIIVDVLAPTFLMFFLVAAVKPPAESNLQRVIEGIDEIVYRGSGQDVYEINARKRKRSFLGFIVGLLYLLGTVLSTGATVLIFYFARVPISSIILDTMNVAVIVFAALVIRQRAKEITVEEKTSFWEFSIDILSIPMAKIGQWLSNKWKEYNIVSVFFTALVDMPFLAFIQFIEGWSSFLKEKKAEIH